MSSITFSEIMDFYPQHNSSVYEDLQKDYQRGSLIPFVGAGLSVFCGYLGWPKVLERLAGFIYDNATRTKILKMIDDEELLLAAQEIYNNYPRMLKELQKIIDYNKIKNCELSVLYASAAYVLPYLFKESIVMTTNFDRVLEEIYDRCHAKFGKIVSPHESDILTQIRQNNPHCLFKLHGDIGPEIHDIDKLVFTQAQYDKAYDSNGQLMQELPQWFQNKRLLFLGCSLQMDRTMEVLQQATVKNPGLDHYAILACKPDDIGKRSRELGDLGISPIFYPMDRHEAVRVILERLLEENDHSAYEELNSHVEKHMSAPKTEHRFMYDSDYIGFTGRKQELERLQDFCQDARKIVWWAVTGPGGMGKSRLVHEFTRARKEEGWKIVWLNHGVYTNLLGWTAPVDRCILVADDVQSYLQIMGEWIASDSIQKRSEKLRILLLEREGENLNSAKWAEMMQSDFPYDNTIQSLCYCSDFLQLEPLADEELKMIMRDFSVAYGKPLGDSEAERLLSTLQKVDGDLRRPIYALAIVDAWCYGDDPTRWDKGRILDELTDRELRFYYDRLRNLSSDRISKELRSEFENLLARSCLEQILPLDSIGEQEYQKLRSRAAKLEMDFFELLRSMGIVHRVMVYVVNEVADKTETQKGRKKIIEAVVLDCPDLVKEYLVIRRAFDKGQMELILPDNWENNPNQLYFFSRILADYPEKLEGKDWFWKNFFAGNPRTDFFAWIYSDLLFGTTIQLPKLEEQALARLEKLHEQYADNEEIAIEYAKGLVNLTVEQTQEECEQSVDKLRKLHEQYADNEEIAVEYAKGLFNLALKQMQEECGQSVDKLRELHERYEDNEEVLNTYAGGISALIVKQPLEECEQSIRELKSLHECSRDNMEVVALYMKSLVNFSFVQDAEESVCKTVQESKEILNQYPEDTELQLSYAQTWFNLTLVQTMEALQQTVSELREYLMRHSEANQKFQLALDQYLEEHPDHTERYSLLRLNV